MKKCLYCYQPLNESETDFHAACAKKIFGTNTPPVIDFELKQLEELAKQIIVRSVAVTGVQPKLSLNLEKHKDGLSRLTLVGLHGDYILKPPSVGYTELPENEDLTMHLAKLVKIKTAQHSLVRLSSGELAYLTKRFDRRNGKKIAVEDFCQLSENLTEHKYRGSVEMIGRLNGGTLVRHKRSFVNDRGTFVNDRGTFVCDERSFVPDKRTFVDDRGTFVGR